MITQNLDSASPFIEGHDSQECHESRNMVRTARWSTGVYAAKR
jgi:hypothetical protein